MFVADRPQTGPDLLLDLLSMCSTPVFTFSAARHTSEQGHRIWALAADAASCWPGLLRHGRRTAGRAVAHLRTTAQTKEPSLTDLEIEASNWRLASYKILSPKYQSKQYSVADSKIRSTIRVCPDLSAAFRLLCPNSAATTHPPFACPDRLSSQHLDLSNADSRTDFLRVVLPSLVVF